MLISGQCIGSNENPTIHLAAYCLEVHCLSSLEMNCISHLHLFHFNSPDVENFKMCVCVWAPHCVCVCVGGHFQSTTVDKD